jgi:hypothetical protein
MAPTSFIISFITISPTQAYGLATVSACGFAYGLGKVVERGPKSLRSLGLLIPLLSVSAANISNLTFTRLSELTEGTAVADENGEVFPLSFCRLGTQIVCSPPTYFHIV